jgi:Protein of unknown function (DUF3618)
MTRTEAQIQSEIEAEREQLAGAVEQLRDSFKPKVPAVAAGAATVGFVLAGGIGATMRYFARRSRERR